MATKKTTKIAGLAVSQTPRHTLTALYGKIIRVLNQMPTDAAYRKHTEEIIAERMTIVNDTCDVNKIEASIGNGQVEELIIQADNELRLARNFLIWKPWEPLENPPPPKQWTWPPYK